MPPDPSISFCASRGSAYKRSVPMLCNGDVLATPLIRARARTCQQSNAYFEGVSLERVPRGFGSLVPGSRPSTLLQSERENCVACQKISLRYFRERLKICEIKDPRNLALYGNLFMTSRIFLICLLKCNVTNAENQF